MGKLNEMIVLAYRKGYRVKDNRLISFTGQILSVCKNNAGYLKAWCVIGDFATSLYVHKLAAYQKFGELVFLPDITVRHLDGDRLNNYLSNIAIGTMSDNKYDMDPERRRKSALIACKEAVNYTRKYPDSLVMEIIQDRKLGRTYRELCNKYKIPKSTLSYMLTHSDYAAELKDK